MSRVFEQATTGLADFWTPARAWPPAVISGLFAFAVYAGGASHLVHTYDPAEFQTLAHTGGIAHAGYPTLVLLLQAFARLPFGTLAWRANLVSACFGALAVGLLAYAAKRWTRSAVASIVAALAFAFSLSMWKESSLAGVHALTLAIDSALLMLALRFAWRPSFWLGSVTAFLFGVGLTCHLTVLALAAPLLVACVIGLRHTTRRIARVAGMAGALLLGLAPFSYVIAHDRPEQPMNYLHDMLEPGESPLAVERPDLAQRIGRMIRLVSGREFLAGVRHDAKPFLVSVLFLALDEAVNEFPFVTWIIALVGLASLVSRRGLPAAMLALWLSGVVVLVGIAGSTSTSRFFFLPGAWCLALGLACGLARLFGRHRGWGGLAMAVVLAMPFVRLALPDPPARPARAAVVRGVWRLWPNEWCPWRREARYDAYGRGVMQRVAPRAVVLGSDWDQSVTLRYFVFGEPLRRDVDVFYAGRRAPRLTRMWREAVAQGRPVYTTALPAPDVMPAARAVEVWDSGWGQLWRVVPTAPESR